jgi:isoamylase
MTFVETPKPFLRKRKTRSFTSYPGKPFPLGAVHNNEGVNFAVFAENAERVFLCLFNETGKKEIAKIEMTERYHQVWHIFIPGLKRGQLYGFRMAGPYDPSGGQRYNENKLLIDPYAKAISGTIRWHDALFGYEIGNADADLSFSTVDSAPFVPKSVVTDPSFNWQNDRPLKIPYEKTVIYEMHVKGFTKLNEKLPENIRGTYAGIAHPGSIGYLKELGITAVELMPVHHFVTDRHLRDRGLSNYWGYNTIGFFAPDIRYASEQEQGAQVKEFKEMVKALHSAGIEIILDVVYNHTGEGNQLGPTLSFRGVDNCSYYRLTEDKRYYMDYTGTGNTLNARLPSVLRLIMDSLRYWITEMHVDGFRFDLASTLARELHDVDRLSSFFDIIHQDPIISQVKLIAEPWDIGEGGYQVGKFPPGWAEWNGKYRDCMRNYWRGADSMLAEFAERFTGSSDLYKNDYRLPTASINFVTAHDGFTLTDLVSYNDKHNEANQEGNNDGENNNLSWNCGEEGPTEDPRIISLRKKQKRNLLTTLLLSQGVPMLVSGDELGRTQKGNNNAYCQDNEISWINWKNADDELLFFVQQLIKYRLKHPAFCRRQWFKGKAIRGSVRKDVAWFLPEGFPMNENNWNDDFAKSLAIYMNGQHIAVGPKGEKIHDDHFYLMFNAHYETLNFILPGEEYGNAWTVDIDTASGFDDTGYKIFNAGAQMEIASRSLVVLRCKNFQAEE